MKYFIAIQALIYLIMSSPAKAQTEHWDTYMAKFGNKPGSVLVDMGHIETAPDKRFPYLVITGPIFQKCNNQGLPDKEEIGTLEEILEGTGGFMQSLTPKVLVGTFTYNCQRVNYYYVKDTTGIRTAIRRLYNRNYKNYEYAINIKYEPDWKSYRTFLYPDEATQTWMENDKIITSMIKSGDSLKKPRDINFELYFHSDTGRSTFRHFAEAKGYTTKKQTQSKNEPILYAIIVSKHMAVKIEDINKLTTELKKEAPLDNGYFSGWTAPQENK